MTTNRPANPTTMPAAARQGGFSLLEIVAILGLLGIVVVAGFALLNAGQPRQQQAVRAAQLAAADQAVAAFAAVNGRLPCPDAAGTGFENCAGGQKGWLPYATLGLDASGPARGAPPMRYTVFRSAGADLGVLSDRYNPAKWDGQLHAFGQSGGLDLCAALQGAASAAAGAAGAHVMVTGAPVNVGYAIADGGADLDGNGSPFDGALNGAAGPGMESPARAGGNGYDDLVAARGFADLQAALGCRDTLRSVETLSQAVEVAAEVNDQKVWTAVMAGITSGINAVKAVVSAIKLGIAIGAVATAGAILATAIAKLSAAIGTCVVLVGCAFIPTASAAVASASVAVAAAATSVVLQVAAIAANLTAFALTTEVTIKAGIAATPGSTNLADQLPTMKAAADAAAAKAAAAEADAAAARSALATLETNYANAVNALYATGRNYEQDGVSRSAYLDSAVAAYRSYAQAVLHYENLQGQAQSARNTANQTATDAATAAAAAAANPSDPIRQQSAAALQAQATQTAAAATAAEAAAATARTAMDNARTAWTNARTAAVNAYYYSYDVTDAEGKKTTVTVDGRGAVGTALDNLVAAYDALRVKERGVIEKEQAAAKARQSATDAQNAYVSLRDELNKPPGAPGGGSAIQVWQGAEAILRQADQRGTSK